LDELRWLIEEWRVSLFAQELKTAEPVSAKRLAKALETLRR
jgi:ATP-dependent helicase HrpA